MQKETFIKQYAAGLNPQQLAAVQAVHGPVLLLAVPGSGKTTVLVTRLGYMVLCRPFWGGAGRADDLPHH